MKKIFTLLLLVVTVAVASAQTTDIEGKMTSIEEKLFSHDSKLSSLQATISQLQSKVDEVTKQNLALKHAIRLTPTIAEDTSIGGLNYKLLSVKGDSIKHTVTAEFSIMKTEELRTLGVDGIAFITEDGECNKGINVSLSSLGGINFFTNNMDISDIPVDTPVKLIITFSKVKGTPQYMVSFVSPNSFWKSEFSLKNIPIKWE